jgi:hypothetical protein
MLTKKTWGKPQLLIYGDVEALTTFNANDLQRIGKIADGAIGLFASFGGL